MIGSSSSDFHDLIALLPFALPAAVVTVLATIFVLVKLAPGVTLSVKVLSWIRRARRALGRSDDERRLVGLRQAFADHLAGMVRDLNLREDWSDRRFAELEAEVEAVGKRRGLLRMPGRAVAEGRRRERSLSKALAASAERLILVQGEPGSGKSVALRHVARMLAETAVKSDAVDSRIPVYVNLKKLEAGESAVDAKLIERFVLAELGARATSDVDSFLADHFWAGVADGTWVFLFDSFDEIPGVLSSTDVDDAVRSYSAAIYDFMHGMNRCRGIVGSRAFRAPVGAHWPTFTILPLSAERKTELVGRAQLSRTQEDIVLNEVLGGDTPVAAMSSNPMFLGLLCEYVRQQGTMPATTHIAFEGYVDQRMRRDEHRVHEKYGVTIDQVRRLAENLSFTMMWVDGLGLNPTRHRLITGLAAIRVPAERAANVAMDALIYMKLAQADEMTMESDSTFTFVHRRFAEYFATCVVLRDPARVPASRLLTDGNWRETAVTLLQTQDERANYVLDEAAVLLRELADVETQTRDGLFAWPPNAHHILLILQTAFRGQRAAIPDSVIAPATQLVERAFHSGQIYDRKAVLEVVGVADDDTLTSLLRAALATPSQWLRDAAYQQIALVTPTPADLAAAIRRNIVRTFLQGRLSRQAMTLRAEVMRLPVPTPFLSLLRGFSVVGPVDAALCTLAVVYASNGASWPWIVLGAIGAPLLAHLSLRSLIFLMNPGGLRAFIMNMRYVSLFADVLGEVVALYLAAVIRLVGPVSFARAVGGSPSDLEVVFVVYATWLGPAAVVYLDAAIRPRLWLVPFSPLFPLTRLAALRWSTVLASLIFSLSLLGAMGVILGIAYLAVSQLPLPPWVILGLGGAAAVATTLATVVLVFDQLRSVQHDRRVLRRWTSESSPMTFDAFAQMLKSLRTTKAQLRFLEGVRRAGLLVGDQETLSGLRGVVASLEREQHSRPRTTVRDTGGVWASQRATRQRLATASLSHPDVLDALGRLIEGVDRVTATVVPRAPAPWRESPA